MCEISIIVPVYNVEKYLNKCIESILNQTFNKFELILVNDGSTDKCGEICDQYKKHDSRIKVIHKQNGGLSSARNAGLEIACGKYIGFIDSDDWIDFSMYDTLYKLAKEYDADIVQCNFTKAYDDNDIKIDSYEDVKNKDVRIIDKNKALSNLMGDQEICVQSVVSWNKLYKKKLFNNIRFPKGKIHEDEFTTYKLFDKCEKIVLTNEKLYFYRQTPNSIMNSKFNNKRLDFIEAREEQLDYFRNTNKYIYELIMYNYEINLKEFYFKVKDFIDDNHNISYELRSKYNKMFVSFVKNKNIPIKSKILESIFYISPSLYRKIQIIRNNSVH